MINVALIRFRMDNTDERIPLEELEVHPDMLRILEDFGVIEIKDNSVDWNSRKRLFRLLRLRNLLGVNLAGAAIIIDLLDHIDDLERQIRLLKRRV